MVLPTQQHLLDDLGFATFGELEQMLRRFPHRVSPDGDEWKRRGVALVRHATARGRVGPRTVASFDDTIADCTRRLALGRPGLGWTWFQYAWLLLVEAALRAHNRASKGPPTWALSAATGSGKTLLLHANLLQARAADHRDDRRALLLTPSELLARQHLRELDRSGIPARLVGDRLDELPRDVVAVCPIHRLADQPGTTTHSVSTFGDDNLLLVDEGHRGASGATWRRYRSALARRGLTFEYSATFGQAVAGNDELAEHYRRSILMDYGFDRFHAEGYGKRFVAVHLAASVDAVQRQRRYLFGAALTNLLLWRSWSALTREDRTRYGLEAPLWAFVGGRVNAVRRSQGTVRSDVLDVLAFVRQMATDPEEAESVASWWLEGGAKAFVDDDGSEAFGHLGGLLADYSSARALTTDVVAAMGCVRGEDLTLTLLDGAPGEIAVAAGDRAPFGVVSVGDAPALVRLATRQGFATTRRRVVTSLFDTVTRNANEQSQLRIVLGSRRFVEGWDTRRLSLLTLLSFGRDEGAQVVQLFGRGIRLAGKDGSLMRSAFLEGPHPPGIDTLETLFILGFRAEYIKQFADLVGRQSGDANRRQSQTPPRPRRTRRAAPRVRPTRIDLYPLVATIGTGEGRVVTKRRARFAEPQRAFLDVSALRRTLVRQALAEGWRVEHAQLEACALWEKLRQSSIEILAPDSLWAPGRPGCVQRWQSTALAVLRRELGP